MTAPTDLSEIQGRLESLGYWMVNVDNRLSRITRSLNLTAPSPDRRPRFFPFNQSDRNAGAKDDRQDSSALKGELGDAASTSAEAHQRGLDVTSFGSFEQGPGVAGVIQGESHGSSPSSMGGTSEARGSAGSPSADSAEHPTLTSETERLIAAEHLLAQHLPTMRSMDRIGLVIELRKILEGRS